MNSSITKRWIKGSLIITIAILIIALIVIAVYVRSSYYRSADAIIMNRVNTISATLSVSDGMSEAQRSELLYRMIDEFSESDKFEFMFIGSQGNIIATSTGFMPSDDAHLEDIILAQDAENGIATNTYTTAMGEKVLTATYIISPAIDNIYAIRLVTSLERVDAQIGAIIALSVIAALCIVIVCILSGVYFINSIVLPIRAIEESANKISKGEFDVRIQNTYHDEIGQLCDAINNMAEELGKSDEIKNDFISSVSHELRTPLTAIKGWAETMTVSNDSDTLKKGTKVILSETERLNSMVENLLDFSRLQQSSIQFTKEKLDIVAEVSDVVIMFTPRCRQNGIELLYEEADEIVPVFADKQRLRQVMINLLDNAIKYTDCGGRIEVGVNYEKRKRQVTVFVKDNGAGIHPDDIDKVAQKFYKGRGAKRGSGIGLALVKEIIEAHKGQFSVESEYGKWTKMSFTLNTVKTLKGNN